MTGWFFRIDAWITGLVFAGLLTIVWALVGRKAAPDGEPRGVPTKGEGAILALLGLPGFETLLAGGLARQAR